MTHVLLAVSCLLRRADGVDVIGSALRAKAAGAGHRPIAGGSQSLFIQHVSLQPGVPNEATVIALRGDHDAGSERLTIRLDGGHTER